MNLTKPDFNWAATQGLLSVEQVDPLWQAFEQRYQDQPKFDFPHVAYYFGALIVISAMGWLFNTAWEVFGGGGMFTIAIAYAVCFTLVGRTLWYKDHLKVPGGLLITMAVCMTPLAIYGFQRMTGFWGQGDPGQYHNYYVWIKGSWFFMELGTILAGSIALIFIRFPFLTAPIAFSLWFMSMDLTPLLFGLEHFHWEEYYLVSLWFGLLMLLVAYLIDNRTKADYAFWLYLFGMLAFWCGLSLLKSDSEFNKFVYCLINLGLMVFSVLLQRRVFIIFGSFGVMGYLGYLSFRLFANSLLFPIVLTVFGIFIIYIGVQYHRYHTQIEQFILGQLPDGLKRLLPSSRILPM